MNSDYNQDDTNAGVEYSPSSTERELANVLQEIGALREMVISARPCVVNELNQMERLILREDRPHYLQVYNEAADKLRKTLDGMNSYLGLDNETVI